MGGRGSAGFATGAGAGLANILAQVFLVPLGITALVVVSEMLPPSPDVPAAVIGPLLEVLFVSGASQPFGGGALVAVGLLSQSHESSVEPDGLTPSPAVAGTFEVRGARVAVEPPRPPRPEPRPRSPPRPWPEPPSWPPLPVRVPRLVDVVPKSAAPVDVGS